MSEERDRALALAALLQAVDGVDRVAHGRGGADDALETAVRSVLTLDAPDADAVFGGAGALYTGLRMLSADPAPEVRDVSVRYGMGALALARALRADNGAAEALRGELGRLEFSPGPPDDALLQKLDRLYRERVRPLGNPILVDGEPTTLGDPQVQAKVRTLLLGAVRAGVLWYQRGGSLWRLVLQRGRIGDTARGILVSS